MRYRAEATPLRSPAGARWRSRVFTLLQHSLVAWACVYFALLAVSGHTYIRSVAFGIALILAVWLIAGALFSDNEPITMPDRSLLWAIGIWSAWSTLSLTWSIHPEYSNAEWGAEVVWGLATAIIFYVAARSGSAFRVMMSAAIATCVLLAILAIAGSLESGTTDHEQTLARAHGGVGAFSTYLVLVMPLLLLMLVKTPTGFGARSPIVIAAIVVFVLMLVAAHVTGNRMIWVALAMGFVVAGSLAAWRWRARLRRAPLRWFAVLLTLLLLFTILFIDAAGRRARTDTNGDSTVARALAQDPRFLLWQHTFERIRERPWTGFGFGKSILREELRSELGDPLLAHAHNLFVSQWLQTGAIGVATLVALLATLAWCYGQFLRAPDDTLAVIGMVGLTLLASFVVKNLTDDFMTRPTSKEFWALNALLVGWGARLADADFARKSFAKSASV